jgi:hypothetical protein
VAGEGELAVEIVGPLVIGADEADRRAVILGADARAAMATAVVEGADDIVAATHDDDGILADLDGEIGAGLGQFAIMAHEQPVAIVDRFHIELEVVLVDIEGLLEAESLAAVLELP